MNSGANRSTLKRQNAQRFYSANAYIPPPPISSNHPSYTPLNIQYRLQELKYGPGYKPKPDYKPKPKSNPFAPRKRKNRKTRKNRKN